jgi:FMN phosphatase YigB (HAD superfamily)
MSVNHSLMLTSSAAKKSTPGYSRKTRKSTFSVSDGSSRSSLVFAGVLLSVQLLLFLKLDRVDAFVSLVSARQTVLQGSDGGVDFGRYRLVGALAVSKNDKEEDGGDGDASGSKVTPTSTTPRLGFLSFDLDDTLFPTSQVVNSANDVMVQKMQNLGFATTVTDFLQQTRQIRSQQHEPITYTALRKLAIRGEMERLLVETQKDGVRIDQAAVEECYDVWEQERHAAAEEYLFSDAIETLQRLRNEHPDVCIAAITNGVGDPGLMANTLEPFFEFCVSGEDDDVFPNRKPHAGIYERSLQRYESLYPHHFQEAQDGTSSSTDRIWCHVGDCLANDVGASASCGAYAVWMYTEAALLLATGSKAPLWSTASDSDIQKRAELSNQGKEKVAVRISSLSELVSAIDELLQGASAKSVAMPL